MGVYDHFDAVLGIFELYSIIMDYKFTGLIEKLRGLSLTDEKFLLR